MFFPRIIPVLLLKGKGLVKTTQFTKPKYIGDPINAVRIFNDLKADELVFLDITASREKRAISEELVKNIGDEAFMPFGVGGGISNIKQMESVLKAGAEKIVINTAAVKNPGLVEMAAANFGSQSIVCCIDVKKSLWGKYHVWINDGSIKTKYDPVNLAELFARMGAGELVINSMDYDGTMKGYDIDLIKSISSKVEIPVIACGGAGSLNDMKKAYEHGGAHALAAGSIFVYHGSRNAVLINYPEKSELEKVFN